MVNKDNEIYTKRHNNNWFCTRCTSSIFPFNYIDDDEEYLETIFEMQSFSPPIPFNVLVAQDRIFSPFELLSLVQPRCRRSRWLVGADIFIIISIDLIKLNIYKIYLPIETYSVTVE